MTRPTFPSNSDDEFPAALDPLSGGAAQGTATREAIAAESPGISPAEYEPRAGEERARHDRPGDTGVVTVLPVANGLGWESVDGSAAPVTRFPLLRNEIVYSTNSAHVTFPTSTSIALAHSSGVTVHYEASVEMIPLKPTNSLVTAGEPLAQSPATTGVAWLDVDATDHRGIRGDPVLVFREAALPGHGAGVITGDPYDFDIESLRLAANSTRSDGRAISAAQRNEQVTGAVMPATPASLAADTPLATGDDLPAALVPRSDDDDPPTAPSR